MARRYGGDPYWLTARFSGTCAKCGKLIAKGARIFYYPNGRKSYCDGPDCGQRASDDFHAAASDEAMMCGESY